MFILGMITGIVILLAIMVIGIILVSKEEELEEGNSNE